ncbi:Tetratricopeptide-like helical [Cordyceps fumosorosea ARSEF 2679]|uniref:Tetratricopeptide-like helical n=1 Tax=Cordyceps fumosorosea (strain ARSEF 2679) TaxID=1081104 RepID=A0A167PAA8_CORFA|nr:Tetratricopeptide-like helical [Cordyceps fumosorosea ARSEF 2679]OAA56453.1 Tetratricopeptide-like helical [Cordyceps fumosorosea ARSEF 2679]
MTSKAANYIEHLDIARCRGDWAVVPELVRKVRKHAPQRECLTLTAETECAISSATTGSERPSIAAIIEKLNVDATIPKLQAAIEAETAHGQDAFQARVCVGWMYWVVAEYALALDHLPSGLAEVGEDARKSLTEWTSVCALKSAYLRANCLMRDNQRQSALAAFQSGLPSLDRVWGGQPVQSQLKYWSELYLTEYCTLTSQSIRQGDATFEQQNSISCFRAWARYWEAMSAPVTGGFGFKGSATSVPRRSIWNEYYQGLSKHLLFDDAFPPASLGNVPADTPARTQLRMELKRVEASYEKLLLSETTFPRADEHREEVEKFIKQVMDNWAILCGRGWSEKDLGQAGRAGISRGVLETLYSAATKTYHSTLILRSLFSVHVAVAEFDLAFKALDSYLEIISKGKARIAKTSIPEPSLDNDSTVLETMAQAIMTLCRYGHHKSAEKARRLGAELEDWLARLSHNKPGTESSSFVPPRVIALSWQAIGLSHAHWSRSTYEAASRTEIQSKAIRCLRKSLSSEYGRSKDTRSLFALGLLLAERKELSSAVEIIRATLMSTKRDENSVNEELYSGPYWQERSLIPMWHLLALLLSARQDYAMASRACDGAVEQFKDSSILFGKAESFKSEHLNDAEAKSISTEAQGGLVDEMDDFEKEELLEVKMTQLALIELQDGPNAAVNSSYELLSLFTRLFGNLSTQSAAPPQSNADSKTASGRSSLRGSIFASKEKPRAVSRQSDEVGDRGTALPIRPPTSAPSIQVTDETPRPPTSQRAGDAPRRNSLKKRNRSQSRGQTSSNGTLCHQGSHIDGEPFFTPSLDGSQPGTPKGPPVAMSTSFLSREKTVSSITSRGSIMSKGTEYSELSLEMTHVPSHVLPLVQFSNEKARSGRTAILVKVWTMIAGFYRRADMLDECKAAISEAEKLVQGLETEAARDPSADGATRSTVWAERKSVEGLWADVSSESGLLALAKGTPFEAREEFETALTHCPDHPAATVGLSNILLDIYSETLLPQPAIPALVNGEVASDPASVALHEHARKAALAAAGILPSVALGLGPSVVVDDEPTAALYRTGASSPSDDGLPAPYKTTSLPLSDRLAARDRAYTLLTGLTRLGSAWDSAEAWFALARAYEESGQPDKAKEVLWWCVELEESSGVRSWRSVAADGYIV